MKKNNGTTASSVFARNLQLVLKQNSLSQREAAKLAKVSASTLNSWTAGRIPSTSLDGAHRLATALGVDFAWLLLGIEPLQQEQKRQSIYDVLEIAEDSEPVVSGIYAIELKRVRLKGQSK